MFVKKTSLSGYKKHSNSLVIEQNIGWLGSKPATTRIDKIRQIKDEFIDDRPLLVVGATPIDFGECRQISATISVSELVKYIDALESSKFKYFLVITGMEDLPEQEQEKFITVLKDRQIMSSVLPECVQIVIPAKDSKTISKSIKSLVFLLEV